VSSNLAGLGRAKFDEMRTLLTRLVSERSVAGSPAIGRCLEIVLEAISPCAVTVDQLSFDGSPVLVARFGSGSEDRRLTFSGHVDVVPSTPGWESEAFTLADRDGHLVGRGTCDMKGGVAAVVTATRALAEIGILDRCSFELVLTGDEEVGSAKGTIPLLKAGWITGRAAVCGEPTGLRVFRGSRGLIWAEVTIEGEGGHAGQAHLLHNPIPTAARLSLALDSISLSAHDERFDPPRPSLVVTRLAAGAELGAVNVIPDRAQIAIDRRLLPEESLDSAVDQIKRCIEAQVTSEFRVDFRVLKKWPGYAVAENEAIVCQAQVAVQALGYPADLGTDLAANDSAWLVHAGIPTVLLGPGEPGQAHVTGERVSTDQVMAAVDVYATLISQTGAEG